MKRSRENFEDTETSEEIITFENLENFERESTRRRTEPLEPTFLADGNSNHFSFQNQQHSLFSSTQQINIEFAPNKVTATNPLNNLEDLANEINKISEEDIEKFRLLAEYYDESDNDVSENSFPLN